MSGKPELHRYHSHVDNELIEGKLPYSSFRVKLCHFSLEDMQDPEHKEMVGMLTSKFKENWDRGLGSESFVEDTFMRTQLRNCIFVGHVNTDLDSIAGAICAAELFKGVAARAEENFNGEIEFALKYTGMQAPNTFSSLPGGANPDGNGKLSKVCLVDHNEVDQMTQALKEDDKRMKRIVGLIDHHAVASSFYTPAPLFMDVRPWGSMCSIIFHNYLRNRVPIRKEIARLLLCAILSDTLNLRSGTTTPADRFSVALLASFGEVEDVDELAMQLFTAKTDWIVGLGAYEMVRGDQKNFQVGNVNLSIAVLEVTSMDPVLKVAEDLLTQIRVFKYEKGNYFDDDTGDKCHDVSKETHCALLFVVNTVAQCSVLLVAGSREKLCAQRAFPEATWRAAGPGVRSPSKHMTAEETLCDVGGLMSRKLEFMPRCTEALRNEPLPEWFTAPSPDLERLVKVLNSDEVVPVSHNSVQVLWDKARLKAAVFNASDALLKDILAKGSATTQSRVARAGGSSDDTASEKDIVRLFRHFDSNGDGVIDRGELATVFKEIDESWTDEKLNDLLAVADTNNDGLIHYEEFVQSACSD